MGWMTSLSNSVKAVKGTRSIDPSLGKSPTCPSLHWPHQFFIHHRTVEGRDTIPFMSALSARNHCQMTARLDSWATWNGQRRIHADSVMTDETCSSEDAWSVNLDSSWAMKPSSLALSSSLPCCCRSSRSCRAARITASADSTSGHSNLTKKGRIDGSIVFTRLCQCAPRSSTPQLAYTLYRWCPPTKWLWAHRPPDVALFRPQNCPFLSGDLDLHLTHGSLGPSESTS